MSYKQCKIEKDVFRAYDIRGIIGEQLNEDAFYSVGKALACRLNHLNRTSILVARDGRLTSSALSKALIQGLLTSGIHVFDLGEVTSPMMYYATNISGIDSGVMITGSHNPSDYNGIKMVLAGTTLAHTDIQILYELVEQGTACSGQGYLETLDIVDDYVHRITGDIKLKRPLKVVVDAGNGIAGPFAPRILRALGCEVVELYCDVDGKFPNHHPDPSVEKNVADLKNLVVETGADLGLAFDGDADRLGVVTRGGELICPDRLMMFYAPAVLKNNPGATIVYDIKCSSALASMITSAGGVARMCPTGHSIVKAIMKQEQAVLAGEMSGHLFFKDRWYGFDDAIYSACRLLEILSESNLSVDEQFASIPNLMSTPEIKIPMLDSKKFDFMQLFIENSSFPDATLIKMDGLRVEFDKGWGLLRASNTTPCLVARFEAENIDELDQIQALFKRELSSLDQELVIPF